MSAVRRLGVAAALMAAAAGGAPAWGAPRELDPRQVESDALAVRNDLQRLTRRDAETRKRLLILKAERTEALMLGDRRRAAALAEQMGTFRRQRAAHARQDRALLRQHRQQLRQSARGTPAP